MDQAKATINLKEGIVQLEGPVEFVSRYLDLYQPGTKRPGGIAATEPPARGAVTGRRRGRRAKLLSSVDLIRAQVDEGFFDEPRSTKNISQRLTEQGLSCSTNSIRSGLKSLVETGLLKREGAGRATRYQRSS